MAAPIGQLQIALRAFERLNGRFFVDREHDRVVGRRRQIAANSGEIGSQNSFSIPASQKIAGGDFRVVQKSTHLKQRLLPEKQGVLREDVPFGSRSRQTPRAGRSPPRSRLVGSGEG